MEVIIIISPLLGEGLLQGTQQDPISRLMYPITASYPLQYIGLSGRRASETTFAKPWHLLENPLTPPFVSSATDVTRPMPLHFAIFPNYVSNFGLLLNNLVLDFFYKMFHNIWKLFDYVIPLLDKSLSLLLPFLTANHGVQSFMERSNSISKSEQIVNATKKLIENVSRNLTEY